MDIKGRVALVTGGATGLGRTFCEELLRYGAKVMNYLVFIFEKYVFEAQFNPLRIGIYLRLGL